MEKYENNQMENQKLDADFDWSVLSFVSGILKEFRATDDVKSAVERILEKIGLLYQVDHTYIVLFSKDEKHAFIWCQWNREGVCSLPMSFETSKNEILNSFRADGFAVYDSVDQLPDASIRETFQRAGAKSTLQGLLIKNEYCFGLIGVDDCTNQRHWMAHEIELLQTSVMLLRERILPLVED